MSILVDRSTRVVVQGITGREGAFHTRQMLEYGTSIVAGVTPGKGGQQEAGVPVYDDVADAIRETGANTSVIYVPAPYAADAILEAADAGIALIVCITEGIPVWDMLRVVRLLEGRPVRLIGPNCPGITSPDLAKVGIIPGHIHRRGPIGVVSRSGTLTYEVVWSLTQAGLGQSTCLGIGGDPIPGSTFVDILRLFGRRSGDGGSGHHRGDRRQCRGTGCGADRERICQAGCRLCSRANGSSGAAHGSRGGHRRWGHGPRRRQDRTAAPRWGARCRLPRANPSDRGRLPRARCWR